MWATKSHGSCLATRHPQAGTSSIEFALIALIFFTFVFGVIEVSRLLFVYNTLQEVTRRAAAAAVNVSPGDSDGIAALKQRAIFLTHSGGLILSPPVTDRNIRLDYLRYDLSTIPQSSLPANAAQNRYICMGNPHAANCIRFVEARVCIASGGDNCQAVKAQMLLPLVDLRLPLPTAPTIALVESLGYVDGTPPQSPPSCGCP